jgi:lysophospholipase L1-like esterase
MHLLAAAALVALLLAIVEGAAALYLRRLGATTYADALAAGGDQVTTALRMLALNPALHPAPLVEDPLILWRNAPGAQKTQPVNPRRFGRDESWTLAVNAAGHRGPDLPPTRPAGYRILCIGDSITFGFGVDQPAPYPRRLEALLRARHPGLAVEVINAGVPGWSWLQGLRFLEAEGLAMRPDLVVQAHGSNDMFFPAQITDRERLTPPRTRVGRFLATVAPAVHRTYAYRALLTLLPRPQSTPSPGCAAQIQHTRTCYRLSVDDVADAVRRARRATAAAGSDYLVMNLDVMETPAVTGSRPAAAAEGIPFLDQVARLRDIRRAEEDERAKRLGLARAEASSDTDRSHPARVRLRVAAPAGVTDVSVRGVAYLSGASPVAAPLHDDATHGDEVAGDRVFTTTIEVPRTVAILEYLYLGNGDREFVPLPPFPSTQGFRLLPITGDATGPVEVFGELPLMLERTHPDARGHEIIAQALVEAVEGMPSWRRFAASHAPPR